MDPVAALNEIAYWLERDLASPFKTKAFRKAADVIAPMPPEQVKELALNGALKTTKGIGGTTFEVIREAVEGRVPDYLVDVRARVDKPLATGGEELRTKLRGDLHSHSDWSDGTTSIEVMADTARWLGHDYLALTDHSPNLRVANGLSPERLRTQLDVIAGLNETYDGFRLLSGIEVDILENGALDQEPELLDRVDIVVASVHSKLRMGSAEMTERMLRAVADPHAHVLGHITGRLVEGSRGTRPESEFDAAAVFAACAERGVAVEVNSRPERQDPPDELIRMALDAGCLFSIDSDAHAPGQLGFLEYGAARATAAGIPAERIITTWPLDELRQWAARER
jgi:putative hydrolase